jgi:hypothetical protein
METMKRFINKSIARFPVCVYVVVVAASVLWCGIIGLMDNEASTPRGFIERYFQPLMLLWYGVPVALTALVLIQVLSKRGYTPQKALYWAVPLSCVVGTAVGLLCIGVSLIVWQFFRYF